MNALTPIATEIAEAAGAPFKAERIERRLSRQEKLFAIRQEKRAKIADLANQFVNDTLASGKPVDWDGYTRATSAIEAEYEKRELAVIGPVKSSAVMVQPIVTPGDVTGLRAWDRV